MSQLTIYNDNNANNILFHSEDLSAIASELNAVGVRFEQWQATAQIDQETSHDAILTAYAKDIER